MTTAATAFVLLVLGLWAFTRFYLKGPSLARYDVAPGSKYKPLPREPSEEHFDVIDSLPGIMPAMSGASFRKRLPELRRMVDSWGDRANLQGIRIEPVDADGVPAEWVLAEDCLSDRRMLYLHGGGWAIGSPRSHRVITTRFARDTRASVLVIDYRLVPEFTRLDCATDCQTAYRWILDNGPNGKEPVKTLYVAGDSAGGSLTLVTIAWARDAGLRPANAAVALSPSTDATLSGPSLIYNLETDLLLSPAFGKVAKLPRSMLLWLAWLAVRVRPCDPRVSPAFGDLSNLPPTLVHASEAEMLLDDARRYVNKATAAGSEATLETWHHMLHVWHAFEPELPEAREAFEHIERFLDLQTPSE